MKKAWVVDAVVSIMKMKRFGKKIVRRRRRSRELRRFVKKNLNLWTTKKK